VQELGFAPLTDQPAPGADGKLIFFLHPKQTHGLLIEFCQRTRSPLEPTYIPFDGGKLGVFELGDPTRPPLVILHGAAGCTSMETEPLIRRLSASFRVLALDFAGHGQSDPFADYRFTPELFIENVRTVFDHFGLEQAGLFGFSLGGFIGLSFAALYPERLSRLAVHATNVFWDPPLIETMLKRLDHEQILDQSPDLARYLAEMHGESGWVSLFERMKAYTLDINRLQARYERAGHVNVPTLVSAVDEDDLFSIDSPVDLFKLLPNAKLAILPGKRHAFQNVNLDVLVPLLLRHFS
jgi:pimeloyl-ACP methyl ester carboxylesterase